MRRVEFERTSAVLFHRRAVVGAEEFLSDAAAVGARGPAGARSAACTRAAARAAAPGARGLELRLINPEDARAACHERQRQERHQETIPLRHHQAP